jgi:hypothetical protein
MVGTSMAIEVVIQVDFLPLSNQRGFSRIAKQ